MTVVTSTNNYVTTDDTLMTADVQAFHWQSVSSTAASLLRLLNKTAW